MTKPNPANPPFPISDADLASALAQIGAEIDYQPLRSSALARIMRETFHGSDASGAWDWRMAYDLMQAAAVQALLRGDNSEDDYSAAKLLASRLLTETRRSEQQIRLQQFSTPLPFAAMAVRAAAIRKGETVLEPSAGTGALAAFAARAGATLLLNEIDPFRQSLLRAVFGGDVTGHDGEHIDDLLQTPVLPDVVVMNPPFASSVDRSRDKHIAAKHLIAAAKRLAPGGRLVAIMPPGFTPERDTAHWSRACGLLTPRLALTMPGQVYRKLGTSVETQLIVFEKVQEDGEMIRASVRDLDEALPFIDAVAATRLEIRPGQWAEAIPHARATVPSSAPRKTVAAPVAASKPRANAVRPLCFTSFDVPRDNTPVSDIYARYRPQRIEIAGTQEHPTPLVESIAMASVAPPVPSGGASAELRLPARLIEEGHLSEAQLETIIMAHDAHGRDLPGRFTIDDDQTKLTRSDDDPEARAYRLGYFLGDGTGCGKGRECAGLILVNWLAGRRKAIWVSKSATLIEDAIRDWTDLGGSPADIQPLSKWKPDQPITVTCGILFVTYATLRSAGKCGTTRLSQILAWMGEDFEGVLAFDEAHAMQNAAGSEQGRGVKPSQQGLAGLQLQLAAPRARVFYISATGATSVHNLAYAARLGLWGQGPEYPFPSREGFVSAMEAGGVAAMEVVARDLKTLGLYTARALSFDGVEYDVLEHALTPAQIEIYDAYATAFRTIHHNLEAALTATGVNDASGETNASAARASAKSRFESTKQRFFNHLLMGMKAPTIIRAIEDDLAVGNACVIQVVSTGESLLKRRLETMDPADELVEGALTPRDYVLGYLEQAFPIHAQKLVEIDGTMVAEPLRDETGALVVSREALALRDAAMMELMTLAPIPSALDQILWAFGDEAVAEVTGRSIRPLKAADGHLFIEKRSLSSNSSETQAFMDGEKNILIFSDAGGTGRSYHAAQTAKNQKRRRHYLLEPGWRADAAIQGLGRTHRSAQVSAPFFRVCTSDVHGEKRFTSTIAKRLDQLGALTKGQRETGSQGMFREEDNLESPIARAALRGYFADLAVGRAEAMSYESFTDWTALRLIDKDGVLLEELPPIQRFLNRVLALPIHMQNALFVEFMRRIADQTERARAAGTLDLGVETLRGERIEQVSTEDLWTCPKSGAVTRIIGLEVTDPVRVLSADDALSRNPDKLPMVNRASGRAALISARPMQMYDEDVVTLMRKAVRPNGSSYLEEARFGSSAWEEISKPEFARLWDAEAASLPKTTTTKLYLLTGLLLPIWKDIRTTNERIYRVTPDGATAMIGRTLSEEGAAALRSRFLVSNPQTPQEMTRADSETRHSVMPPHSRGGSSTEYWRPDMAYDTANTYETIELFGLTEKDAQLPIPEDHVLTDHIIRESFEALLGPLRGTGLEAEIEPLAHGLATILQRRKVALGKEVDRTADKIGALAKSHDGSEIAETALEEAQARFLQLREIVGAIEVMSEAAAECYEIETGYAFIPAAGSRASVRAQETGAVFEARQLLEQHDRETAEKSKVEGVPLIVSGATDWTDVDVIFNTLDKVRERIKQNRNQEIFLCHKGGKHGAEMIAARWARARGVAQARFDPRWSAHGRAAPFKCNDEMLDDKFAATGVVLFGGNGVALNLGQKAEAKGLTVMRVADPAKKTAEA